MLIVSLELLAVLTIFTLQSSVPEEHKTNETIEVHKNFPQFFLLKWSIRKDRQKFQFEIFFVKNSRSMTSILLLY